MKLRELSVESQVIWIAVLVTLKLVLLGVTGITIGSEQTVALSIALDLLFFAVGIFFSRTLIVTYLFTGILCLLLYLSYHFEAGAKFTVGGDDQGYYENFFILINSIGIGDGYTALARADLTTLLMALASVPFRSVGLEFKSPIDFFLLQASCLAPLGPLIKQLSEKISEKNISILYFLGFTPYWYFGIVGREWPLYYVAILITLVFLSNIRSIIYLSVSSICMYLAFLVRVESLLIFGIFVLFHLRRKAVFCVVVISLLLTLVYFSEYVNTMLDFAASKSQIIYFSKVEQSTGIGGMLKYSESIFIKLIFILYLIISPIPPYLFTNQTVENLLLLPGHLMWPVLVFTFALRFTRFPRVIIYSVGIRSAVAGFSAVILLMAFYGGTNRHYYPFIPHLLLALPLLFSTQRSFVQTLKLPVVGMAFLALFYIGLSVAL